MGNRLTQIATRTGDDGTTGLGDNTRVSKDSPRPHAMGDVDELNSHLGLLLCEPLPQDVRELLIDVQHQLFNLGGELSIPGFELLKDEAVLQLDEALAHYNARCRACKSSSCPQARAPPPRPMCAAPWPAARSAPWWRWASRRPCARPRATTSTGFPICCLCCRACSTAWMAATTCTGRASGWHAAHRRVLSNAIFLIAVCD